MTILALDTTTEFGSFCVRRDGRTIAQRRLHSTTGFGQVIFGEIEALGYPVTEVDCFAAAMGPGSFTGVRVGLAAIKGLADALGKPVCGVSNLRALACYGTAPKRAVLLDGRRGDVFAAIYSADLKPVMAEQVLPLQAWLASEPAFDEIIAPAALLPALPEFHILEAPLYIAEAIAICAERSAGDESAWTDPAMLDANYVRRADAELAWRDR